MDGITGIDWQVRPLAGALGAEVLGCNVAGLDEAGFTAIDQAFLEHQVLVFRRRPDRSVRRRPGS